MHLCSGGAALLVSVVDEAMSIGEVAMIPPPNRHPVSPTEPQTEASTAVVKVTAPSGLQ